MSATRSDHTTTTTTSAKKTLGMLSLVFGIVSIVLSPFVPIIWILFGIAAVILGFLSRRSEPAARKLALGGIVTGFVGIALNIASMVAGAVIMSEYMS